MKYLLSTILALTMFIGGIFVANAAQSSFTTSLTTFGSDSISPSVPTSLVAIPVSQNQINLLWSTSTDNVAVGGYVVYRDGNAIATTTFTNYSDSSLLASTTYTYYVQAFDTSFNYSATSTSVSTTTLPIPPVITPTSTPPTGSSGSSGSQFIYNLFATPQITSSLVSFQTRTPVRTTLSWGVTQDYEIGSLTSSLYNTSHNINIDYLQPSTHYFVKIIATDAQGIQYQALIDFVTKSGTALPLQNPSNFIAKSVGPGQNGVNLSWTNPSDPRVTSVRVIRGESFFPKDQYDGTPIYQGLAQKFFDANREPGKTYYYAIFSEDANGAFSSGVVSNARILNLGEIPESGYFNPFTQATTSSSLNPIISNLTLQDFQFIQEGKDLNVGSGNTVTIDGLKNFTVRLAYNKVPEILKTIAVSLSDPNDSSKAFIFLLRANQNKAFYEANVAPLNFKGTFPMAISILDYQNQSLKQIGGNLTASVGEIPVSFDLFGQISFWIFLLIFVLLLLLTLFLFKRHKNKKENNNFIPNSIPPISLIIFIFGTALLFGLNQAQADFNQQINYQGKLTTPSNIAVADGQYPMVFKLYTTPTGGSPIWTETDFGANQPTVTGGLFSIMLGSTTPLVGIDFNQTYYLGVTVASDTEMIPRKIIGAVPAAFYAGTSTYAINSATSTYASNSSTSTYALTSGTSTFATNSATSTYSLTSGTSTYATLSGTSTNALSAQTLQNITPGQFFRNDIQNATSSASTFLNVLQSGAGKIAEFFGQAGQSVLAILSNGSIGIGTSTPSATLTIQGTSTAPSTNLLSIASSTGASLLMVLNNGNVGIGTNNPSSPLTVIGTTSVGSLLLNSLPITSPVSNSIFAGVNAGSGASFASDSNFFGNNAGNGASGADDTNCFGQYSCYSASNIWFSNFFGSYAGYEATNAGFSNFFGGYAGYAAANADNSNFFGSYAGQNATNASYSNFFGPGSGLNATNASYSNFIGNNAGNGAASSSNSIFIGNYAGQSDTVNNLSGNKSSILIGNYTKTGGFSNSIAIGQGTQNSAQDQVNIGRVLYLTGIGSSTTPIATPITGGRFGIGTSSPSATLSVAGDGYFTGNITGANITATGTLNVTGQTTLGNASTTNVTVSNNLNVTSTTTTGGLSIASLSGLLWGTSGAVSAVSTSSLGLASSASLTALTSSLSNGFLPRWNGTTLVNSLFSGNGTVTGINATSSSYTFNVQGTSGVNPFNVSSSTGTSLLTVLNNGNVGIGTSSPSQPLDVNGNAQFNLGTNGYLKLLSNSGYNPGFIQSTYGNFLFSNNLYFDGTDWRYSGTGYGVTAQTDGTAGNFNIYTVASSTANSTTTLTNRFTVLNNGNVGIGTISPTNKLQVEKAGDVFVRVIDTNTADLMLGIFGGYSGLWLGTTTPSYLNYSVLSQGTGQTLINANNSGYADMEFRIGNVTKFAVGNNGIAYGIGDNIAPANPIEIRSSVGGSVGLLMNSSGNVGIGTSSPSNKLEVVGNGYFAGNLTATGTLNVSGKSTLGNASTTNVTVSNNLNVTSTTTTGGLSIASLSGLLWGTNGAVSAISTSSLGIPNYWTQSGATTTNTVANLASTLGVFGTIQATSTGTSLFGATTGNQVLIGHDYSFQSENNPYIGFLNTQTDSGYSTPAYIFYSKDAVNTAQNALYITGGSHNNRIFIGSASQPTYALNLANISVIESIPSLNLAKGNQIYWQDPNDSITVTDGGISGKSNTMTSVTYDGGANTGAWLWKGYSSNYPYLSILGENGKGTIGIGTTTQTATLTIQPAVNTNPFIIASSSGSQLVKVSTDGSLQLNKYTGNSTLQTDASGNVTNSSDERLKNIQGNFTKGLSAIMGLNPINYTWKASTGFDTLNIYTGFSAQNVQSSIPEAVGQNSEGFLTLNDRPIIATLVNAIKEQQSEINNATSSISTLTIGQNNLASSSVSTLVTLNSLSNQVQTLSINLDTSSSTFYSYISDLNNKLALATSTLASTTADQLSNSNSFIQKIADAVVALLDASGQVIASAGDWTVHQITAVTGAFQKVLATRVETQTASVTNGIEMTSPNGQVWCVKVDDSGNFTRTSGGCENIASSTIQNNLVQNINPQISSPNQNTVQNIPIVASTTSSSTLLTNNASSTQIQNSTTTAIISTPLVASSTIVTTNATTTPTQDSTPSISSTPVNTGDNTNTGTSVQTELPTVSSVSTQTAPVVQTETVSAVTNVESITNN